MARRKKTYNQNENYLQFNGQIKQLNVHNTRINSEHT